jgi:4-hydroxy-tetrahydrodipicolinate synthase
VLSRGTSAAAQYDHFCKILAAGVDLPSVIYNSPYYGYQTKAELFFSLRQKHKNLVGFKEFGGADSLDYAAEHITSGDPELSLMIGVDTQVVHGFLYCGAAGAITGVGNALPTEVLRLVKLCQDAVKGDSQAKAWAHELNDALAVLSTFDEGPDLVLYYKRLMVLEGNPEYEHQMQGCDKLSASQKGFIDQQWRQFRDWWSQWPGK